MLEKVHKGKDIGINKKAKHKANFKGKKERKSVKQRHDDS